jgi:hypothetical protein
MELIIEEVIKNYQTGINLLILSSVISQLFILWKKGTLEELWTNIENSRVIASYLV